MATATPARRWFAPRRWGGSRHEPLVLADRATVSEGRRRWGHVRVSRSVATVSLLAATFAVLVIAAPGGHPQSGAWVTVVTVPSVLGAVVATALWIAAPRLSLVRRAALSVAAIALVASAAALATVRQPAGAPASFVDHRTWTIAAGAVALGTLVVAHLVAELRARIRLLDGLARVDALTQVGNRRSWDEELVRELARAQRERTSLCVAMIDLDHFKAFNDLRGHQEGDRLLRQVAHVWRQLVRQSDFLARVGGEEFAVLLRHCRLEDALPVAERIRMSVGEGQTCSVGLATWRHGESADDLMVRADAALYNAKMAGRDRVRVAHEGGSAPAATTRWPAVIQRLLDDRSVVAAYQPVVRLSDRRVLAYEALARPNRHEVDISVEQMFSNAQRMGLSRDLDWLCRRAALQGARTMPAGMPLFVNVGLSGLIDPVHRVDQMLLVCESVGRSPRDLVLEITERELVGDLRRLREVVNTYRREGFRFAVDDVGEGHSTLEVLSTTEPEFVKVARSLVVGAVNRGPRAAVRAVVSFAAEVNASVIAEGIEKVETAALMGELGVGLAQGYLFGRPTIPALGAGLLATG